MKCTCIILSLLNNGWIGVEMSTKIKGGQSVLGNEMLGLEKSRGRNVIFLICVCCTLQMDNAAIDALCNKINPYQLYLSLFYYFLL